MTNIFFCSVLGPRRLNDILSSSLCSPRDQTRLSSNQLILNIFYLFKIWSFDLKSFFEPFQNLDHVLKWGNFSTSKSQTECIVLVSQFLRDSLSCKSSNIHPIFALCKKNLLSPNAISTGIGFVQIIWAEPSFNQIMCWA